MQVPVFWTGAWIYSPLASAHITPCFFWAGHADFVDACHTISWAPWEAKKLKYGHVHVRVVVYCLCMFWLCTNLILEYMLQYFWSTAFHIHLGVAMVYLKNDLVIIAFFARIEMEKSRPFSWPVYNQRSTQWKQTKEQQEKCVTEKCSTKGESIFLVRPTAKMSHDAICKHPTW